jgi:hypothetical protein
MNTSSIAHTLSCRAEWDLAVCARRIGIALFAVTVAALESWRKFPIQPLLNGYFQSSMFRISSVATSAFRLRSH